ncbi:hypothetical protein [Halorussus marinus]|uniref:hypothetical protein n=1 Tax=Halorussus marinus TaxID=2505976 RepID=UPI00106EA282|nr:hypothetical protein [Halorussus marinus]
MNRDRAVEIAVGVFVTALFVLSAFGVYGAVLEGEGVLSALFGVYLTGLLLFAVLRDSMRTRGWRLAFFSGVAVWGTYEYFAADGGVLSLALAAIGVVMVAANAIDR